MRTLDLASLVCIGGLVIACGGGQKKTNDPSSKEAKDDGATEKWEGATADDQKARNTGSGSGSSGSSSGSGSSGSGSGGSDTSSGSSGSGSSGSVSGASGAATTNSGSSAPPVASPPTRRSDQYDKEHTDIVLNRAVRQVKANCGLATDDTGKPAGPWGKVTISVMLGRNGHSKGATVPAPYDGTPPGRCIVHAFSSLTFPPWGGADTPVDVELEIPKPEGAKPGK